MKPPRTKKSAKSKPLTLQQQGAQLTAFALALPGATLDTPWDDDRVAKVNGKIFAFFGRVPTAESWLSLGVKLPQSHGAALVYPFAQEMGYGLGKSGWVTSRFTAADSVPIDLLCDWIMESYRALAPKKLIAQLDVHRTD